MNLMYCWQSTKNYRIYSIEIRCDSVSTESSSSAIMYVEIVYDVPHFAHHKCQCFGIIKSIVSISNNWCTHEISSVMKLSIATKRVLQNLSILHFVNNGNLNYEVTRNSSCPLIQYFR